MRKLLTIICLLLTGAVIYAQPVFKVITPQAPVGIGQPFTVQYIMDASGAASFTLPEASAFSFVNGPDEYITGNNLINKVYTLVGRIEGKNVLPEASVTIKGKTYYTKPATIDILPVEGISPKGAVPATEELSTLLPGEDPYKKIKDNIVIQVEVNRKQCMVGEPVVATYKIYSNLSSESDIIKNPAFYGFAAVDIINLEKPVTTDETFRGKKYSVHTVRKVQLYPSQAGKFTIDAMEVLHRVTFAQGQTPHPTVTEGVIHNKDTNGKGIVYESRMSSQPVVINVLPLPEANRPDSFGMATGKFSLTATVNKTVLAKNETCLLSVALTGKGNIIQIASPAIEWPSVMENFEPRIQDTINREQVPLTGTRTFLYNFLSPRSGEYTIPAIAFTYFDTDSNRYKTIHTRPVKVVVEDREYVAQQENLQQGGQTKAASRSTWLFIGVLLVLGIGIAAMWLSSKKEKKVTARQQATAHIKTAEAFLAPATAALQEEGNDNQFYTLLRKGIYDYLAQFLQQPVSSTNKQNLQALLYTRQVTPEQATKLFAIIEQCEHGAFTLASLQHNKEALLQETLALLKQF
ncbi:BatD family protein [Terrimonas rubra]|uniref:BatD family protein n=1 Tax=Terrimonas rubra TaxID=1035890 RepID=A0ABW6A105_9BACT